MTMPGNKPTRSRPPAPKGQGGSDLVRAMELAYRDAQRLAQWKRAYLAQLETAAGNLQVEP